MAAPAGDEAETSIVHRVRFLSLLFSPSWIKPSLTEKIAYIFNPSDDEDDEVESGLVAGVTPSTRRGRKHGRADDMTPTKAKKRRPTAKSRPGEEGGGDEHDNGDDDDNALAAFPPLLQGREAPEAVARRRQLFTSLWSQLDDRIQVCFRYLLVLFFVLHIRFLTL